MNYGDDDHDDYDDEYNNNNNNNKYNMREKDWNTCTISIRTTGRKRPVMKEYNSTVMSRY